MLYYLKQRAEMLAGELVSALGGGRGKGLPLSALASHCTTIGAGPETDTAMRSWQAIHSRLQMLAHARGHLPVDMPRADRTYVNGPASRSNAYAVSHPCHVSRLHGVWPNGSTDYKVSWRLRRARLSAPSSLPAAPDRLTASRASGVRCASSQQSWTACTPLCRLDVGKQ